MDARKEYGSITLLCFFHSDPLEVTVDTPGTQPTVEGSLKVESSPHADMLPAGPSVPGRYSRHITTVSINKDHP